MNAVTRTRSSDSGFSSPLRTVNVGTHARGSDGEDMEQLRELSKLNTQPLRNNIKAGAQHV